MTGRSEVSPLTSVRISIPTRAERLAAQANFNSLGRRCLSLKMGLLGSIVCEGLVTVTTTATSYWFRLNTSR